MSNVGHNTWLERILSQNSFGIGKRPLPSTDDGEKAPHSRNGYVLPDEGRDQAPPDRPSEGGWPEHSRRGWAATYIFMLAVALGFLSLVLLSAPPTRAGLTFQAVFAYGSFAGATGLVACLWDRRILTVAMSVLMISLGFGSVLAMTMLPVPALEPLLQASGAWKNAPIPLNEGWSDFVMALSDMICGLALILAGSRQATVAFISITIVRTCLWGGAFWQLAYVMLAGQLSRLFSSPDRAAVQIGLFLAFAIMIPILFRGDRGWLRTFSGAETHYRLSRYILPLALLPVIAAYAMSVASHLDAQDGAAFTLLNIEIVAACLVLMALTTLRIRWGRRHIDDGIKDALQSAPAIVMSRDGHIEHWPTECVQIYGFPAEEAIGRHAPTLLKTEYRESYEEIVEAMASAPFWAGEVAQWTSDGRRLRILVRLVFHEIDNGRDTKVVATVTDITRLDLTAP